ncbi:hypothetical protein H3C61_04020 [Candidatus Gracilibacteria bacterium]|nr:hypothetical protein [Candidatus Gracilibacteria bacterium]
METQSCNIQNDSQKLSNLINKISSDNKINGADKQELNELIENYENEKTQCLQETKNSLKDLLKKSLENGFLVKNKNDFFVLKQMLKIIGNNSNLGEFDRAQTNHVIWLKNDELFLGKNNISNIDFLGTSYLRKFNNGIWEDISLDIEFQLNKNSFKKEDIGFIENHQIKGTSNNQEAILPLKELEKIEIANNTSVKKVIIKNTKKKEITQTTDLIQPTQKIDDNNTNEDKKITIDISSGITIGNKEQYDRIKKSFKLPDWEKLPDEIRNKTSSQVLTLAEDKEKQVIDLYFGEKRINDNGQEYVMKYGKIINGEFEKSSFFERNFSWDNLENNVKI